MAEKEVQINIEDKYDRIVGATFTNLYTFSNKDGVILLDNFNPKDKKDLCLYEIAKSICSIYNRPIAINMNIFKYLIFKLKKENRKNNIKFSFNNKKEPISNKELLEFVAKAFSEEVSVFENIYDTFYNRKDLLNENN